MERLANLTTIIANILVIPSIIGGYLYFFGLGKRKVIIISSKDFGIETNENEIIDALRPEKNMDEIIKIVFDNSNPKDFCDKNKSLLQQVKENYNKIGVFGISEMFLFFRLGYYLQDIIDIKGFRKLKPEQNYKGNPRGWATLFGLKYKLRYCAKFTNTNEYALSGDIGGLEIKDDINLILPISWNIDTLKIPEELQKNKSIIYGLEYPDRTFLISYSQVNQFHKNIKDIISRIGQKIGSNGKIHIFGQLPAPFLLVLGQSIHRNDPECIFYSLNKEKTEYIEQISTKNIL